MRPEPRPTTPDMDRNGILPPAYHAARTLYHQGRAAEALEQVESIFLPSGRWAGPDSGYPVPDPEHCLRKATILKTWCLIEMMDHAAARGWLDRAVRLDHVDPRDPRVEVLDLNLKLYAESYQEVEDRCRLLLTMRSEKSDLVQAELRLLLGASLRWQGDLEDAVEHVEFASSAFTVLDEPVRGAVAANFLGWTHLSLGRLDLARRWFEKSLDLNSGLQSPLRVAQNYQNLAIVCYKQGDYGLAAELLDRQMDLIDGHPDKQCRALIARGNVHRLLGEYHRARSTLLEAYSLAVETDLAREKVLALEFLGDIFRDEGNVQEAGIYYDRGLAIARMIAPRGDLVMELLRRQGECLDLAGSHEKAQHLLNEARELGEAVADRFELAVIYRCLGVNAGNLGRWKQARRFLEQSLSRLKSLTARHEAMTASFSLAKLLVRQVDTGHADQPSCKLLDQAWQHAIEAQALNRELEIVHLNRSLEEFVGILAKRRLGSMDEPPLALVFSARRAPSSRVIAVSTAMQQVLRRCDGFARYDTPVLICGEPGTGKELLARRIHENSPRGAQPFLRIPCMEVSADALEKELYGHLELAASAGSQPTARLVPGLIGQAEGGTLFLDGIDTLSQEHQARLLSFIQEGLYRPAATTERRKANVRIVATTTRDLGALTDQRRFRQDLYFRLRMMSVAVPALRERPADLLPMMDHFLTRLEGSTLTARSLFDYHSLEQLARHDWPGNAVEVEALAQEAWLNRGLDTPVALRRVEGPNGSRLEFGDTVRAGGPSAPDHPSGMTWSSLNRLIERTGGNKTRVARNLGVSRITLYRWLKQLDPKSA